MAVQEILVLLDRVRILAGQLFFGSFLPYSIKVVQKILVLLVWVRILVGQQPNVAAQDTVLRRFLVYKTVTKTSLERFICGAGLAPSPAAAAGVFPICDGRDKRSRANTHSGVGAALRGLAGAHLISPLRFSSSKSSGVSMLRLSSSVSNAFMLYPFSSHRNCSRLSHFSKSPGCNLVSSWSVAVR